MRGGRGAAARLREDRHARIRAMVDQHAGHVTLVLRRAGVPPSELDDEVQRTFMVAARRIDDVRLGRERGFLVQVAQNVAWHARRKLARRREVLEGDPPERIETVATPEFLADRKQMRQLLDNIVGSLPGGLRVVFTMFAFEEMNMSEIARALRLPRGTVASRLRRARARFRQHVAAIQLRGTVSAEAGRRIAEPAPLRREQVSALEHALLAAGVSAHASTSALAKILAALGLPQPGGRR
jgi:RNA polymerase sigma-70 factor (ECF subfamily)